MLELLHLRGVSIERVPELPTTSAPGSLGFLGEPLSLDEARRRAEAAALQMRHLQQRERVMLAAMTPSSDTSPSASSVIASPRLAICRPRQPDA